jgi:SPASM domain peptide maturase of grasp-with-spasm system
MKNSNPYFKIYSNCIPVKGAKRSIICDLQYGRYLFIPNTLYEILLLVNKNYSINSIKKTFSNTLDVGISSYFNFLVEEEWGFYTSTPNNFPKLDLTWENPSEITNAIIDCNSKSNLDFRKIFKGLEDLGCETIQVRLFWKASSNFIREVCNIYMQHSFTYLEIITSFDSDIGILEYKELFSKILSLRLLVLYASDKNEIIEVDNTVFNKIVKSTDNISSCLGCGVVSKEYFTSNVQHFTEAQKHNTCLNRKISIDVNGNIKNCPSMPNDFGNIESNTLAEVLEKRGFKKFWNINKDQISICKDCEFRYICTDCRAYLSDKKDIYSKPLKCDYNPYTAKWDNSMPVNL